MYRFGPILVGTPCETCGVLGATLDHTTRVRAYNYGGDIGASCVPCYNAMYDNYLKG